MIKKIVLVLTIMIILISCKSTSSENHDDVVPLKVGNVWKYKVYNKSNDLIAFKMLKIRGSKTIKVNNEDRMVYYWNWYHNTIDDSPLKHFELVGIKDHSLISYGYSDGTKDIIDSTMFAKHPVSAGDDWQKNLYEYSGKPAQISLKEKVKVTCNDSRGIYFINNRKYGCIVYSYKMKMPEHIRPEDVIMVKHYFAPTIGLIAIEEYYPGDKVNKPTRRTVLHQVSIKND